MSRPSQAKHRKKKMRQKRVAAKLLRQAEWRRRAPPDAARPPARPAFVFEDYGAPADFVDLVREAVGTIRFDDPAMFHPMMRWFLGAEGLLRRVPRQLARPVTGLSLRTALRLGQAVFDRIGEGRLLAYIPFHDVQFLFRGREVRVHFRSLCRAAGRGGTVYHSVHRPTLEIDGRASVVGFSASPSKVG